MLDNEKTNHDDTPTISAPQSVRLARDILLPLLWSMFAFLGASVLFGLALGVWIGVKNGSPEAVAAATGNLQTNVYFQNACMLVIYAAVFYFLRRARRQSGESIPRDCYRPVTRKTALEAVVIGLFLGFAVSSVITIWVSHGHSIRLHSSETALLPGKLNDLGTSAIIRKVMVFVLTILVAPFVEEIYFRRLIFGWMRQKWPLAGAVVASALIFSLFHGKPIIHPDGLGVISTLGIAVAGAVAALLYHRHKSLWPAALMHGGYNFFLIFGAMLIK